MFRDKKKQNKKKDGDTALRGEEQQLLDWLVSAPPTQEQLLPVCQSRCGDIFLGLYERCGTHQNHHRRKSPHRRVDDSILQETDQMSASP